MVGIEMLIVTKTTKAKKHPTIVIGTPVYTPSKLDILYLANLKAPQIGNNNNTLNPINPKGPYSDKLYIINIKIDGATPKDTKSAKESSSLPTSLVTLRYLAILPSYLSTSPANKIKIEAHK